MPIAPTNLPRIKGQEVSLMLIENNAPLQTIQDVKSFEMAAQLEIIKEGYLGETTDRRDTIYRGYRGKIEINLETRDALDFIRRLVDRARRRTGGVANPAGGSTGTTTTRVNCKVTLNFPGGQRIRLVLKDLQFGEVPLAFGSRSDYGTMSLDFEGEDYQVI